MAGGQGQGLIGSLAPRGHPLHPGSQGSLPHPALSCALSDPLSPRGKIHTSGGKGGAPGWLRRLSVQSQGRGIEPRVGLRRSLLKILPFPLLTSLTRLAPSLSLKQIHIHTHTPGLLPHPSSGTVGQRPLPSEPYFRQLKTEMPPSRDQCKDRVKKDRKHRAQPALSKRQAGSRAATGPFPVLDERSVPSGD